MIYFTLKNNSWFEKKLFLYSIIFLKTMEWLKWSSSHSWNWEWMKTNSWKNSYGVLQMQILFKMVDA